MLSIKIIQLSSRMKEVKAAIMTMRQKKMIQAMKKVDIKGR